MTLGRTISSVALVVALAMPGLLAGGCATTGGRDLTVRASELEGAAIATIIPTQVPLRDLQWDGNAILGIAGREILSVKPEQVGEPASFQVWELPEDVQPRPILAVDAGRIWLVDSTRLSLYRVTLGETLTIERFVLPGALEGARFVDLEWDRSRQLLWGVERLGHRVVALSIDEAGARAELRHVIGGLGRGGMRFNVPLDLAIGDSGSLWVLDSLNRRVVQIDPESSSVGRVLGGDDPAHRGMLPRPRAMCLDSHGDPWVYDDALGKLIHFDLQHEGNASGTRVGSIALPASASRVVRAGNQFLVGQPLSTRVLQLTPSR